MSDPKAPTVIRRRPEAAPAEVTAEVTAEITAVHAANASTPASVAAPVNQPAPPPAAAAAPAPAPSVKATASTDAGRSWHAAPAAPAPAPVETVAQRPAFDGPMPTTDDFEAMLRGTPLNVLHVEAGDRVKARVVSLGKDTVFVSLGGKSEGAISAAELLDADGKLIVNIGDEVEAYVTRVRGDSIELAVTLGRGSDADEMLNSAWAAQIPVEGRVVGSNKGGFEVEIMGRRAFCPFSQIDADGGGNEPERWMNQVLRFVVTRVEEGGRNVVVSRTQLQRSERESKAKDTLAILKPDLEIDGVVTRVAEFGAFVDIGGLDGLVHVSEMSWARGTAAADLVKIGDRVRVRVLRIDDADDTKARRISLSMKALQEDPWHTAARELAIGGTYAGTVSKLERFGAFIELRPGVEGLVHISEISGTKRISHPKELLSVGDRVQVQLVGMDPRKRQLELSIKATQDDPWAAAAAQLQPGQVLQGTVEGVEKFGIFVEIPGGLRGLLPLSQLLEGEDKTVHNKFRAGTAIEVRVLEIDSARRRLTLTRREGGGADGKSDFAEYRATQQRGGASLGTFGDLLARRKG